MDSRLMHCDLRPWSVIDMDFFNLFVVLIGGLVNN